MAEDTQQTTMAAKYSFPYHHLVEANGSTWRAHRHLSWGYEYLGYIRTVVEKLQARSAQQILEVGCGDGRLITEMLDSGLTGITGIDIDERAVMFAQAFNYGRGASLHAGDVRELDAEGFDAAVALEVIEHIPDSELQSTIEAIWKRLEPNGFLLVTVPTLNIPLTPVHFRHYDLALLQEHLSPYFKIEEHRYLHRPGVLEKLLRMVAANRIYILNANRVLRLLSAGYRRVALNASADNGSHLIAVARRVANV